jgi:hypothetical protein
LAAILSLNCVKFPAEATAGLSFSASVAFADYPAPTWTMQLHLRGPAQIDLTATAGGTSHKFTADAAATTAWAPGTYWFALRATDGDDVKEAATGQLVVLPDLAAVTGTYDGRTQNEIALASISAVLAKRATQDQQKYTINNRELWRTPIADLLKLRAFYAAAVRREKGTKSGNSAWGRAIQVRFS